MERCRIFYSRDGNRRTAHVIGTCIEVIETSTKDEDILIIAPTKSAGQTGDGSWLEVAGMCF